MMQTILPLKLNSIVVLFGSILIFQNHLGTSSKPQNLKGNYFSER